jgi:O-methyltransferase involved in polyketide biosynthesis
VLEFKTGTLESHAVDPIASHVSLGIDLRLDWPKALTEARLQLRIAAAVFVSATVYAQSRRLICDERSKRSHPDPSRATVPRCRELSP